MITAQAIKSARLNAGLTQMQAAALVSKNWRSWQRYESGEVTIHAGVWELFLIKTGQK